MAAAAGIALFAFLLFVEIRSLTGPIYGAHEWRQGETYSVALGFVRESWNFFYPRHAWREDTSGILGMEPPVYPYAVAALIAAFGDTPIVGRVLNFALFLLAFAFFCRQLAKFGGRSLALSCIAIAGFSPMVIAEFRQIQPDPAMASLSIIAAGFFFLHGRNGAGRHFAAGLVAYTFALLTKPIAIALLPAMWLFTVVGERRPSWRRAILNGLAFALPVMLMFAWDKWANHLVQTYMKGQLIISIDHDPKQMWKEAMNADARRMIFMALLPNWIIHCLLFPFVLGGSVIALDRRHRAMGLPFWVWLAGASVISVAFSLRYYSNWYYMFVFLPPVLFFGAVGIRTWADVVVGGDRRPWAVAFAVGATAAALAILPLLKKVPWHLVDHIPEQLAAHTRMNLTRTADYWFVLVLGFVVGAATLASERIVPRAMRTLGGPLLALALFGALYVPVKDSIQTARFFTGEPDWKRGYEEQAAIRMAVNEHSTAQDLALVCQSNPALLYRIDRNGFADDTFRVLERKLAYYREKNVRLYFHQPSCGPIPYPLRRLPKLADGGSWALYCVAEDQCRGS